MIARLRMRLVCGLACALASGSVAVLFTSNRWVGYVLGCIVVITITNVVARLLRCPLGAIPILDFTVLLLYLSTAFGVDQFAGVIPTQATLLSLQAGLRSASADIAGLAAPAPAHLGLILVTSAAFGAVTAAVDAIAVGLRRPAMAGIPLLVTLVVPGMVAPGGVGWRAFVLTGLGYLAILLVDDRDRAVRWGPRLSDRGAPVRAGIGQLLRSRATGPLAAAVVIGVAVVVPLVASTVTAGGLNVAIAGSGVGLGAREGSRTAQVTDPVTELQGQLNRSDPIELLRLTPSSTQTYLRLTTLDDFTPNQGWSQSKLSASSKDRVDSDLPEPVRGPGTPTEKVTANVTVTELTSRYLPIYPEPTKVNVKGDWRYNAGAGTVFSTRTDTRGLTYSISGVEPRDSAALTAKLRASKPLSADNPIAKSYERIDAATQIGSKVSGITGTTSSPYLRTQAVYHFFTDPAHGFTYSLATKPGTSGSQLLDFINNRKGYCEQYASAMAAMVRLAGVPARVAVGYTAGTQMDGYRSITTDDAHAWVEVYFAGVGWTTWDPTPPSANGRATAASYTSLDQPAPTASPSPQAAVPSASPKAAPSPTSDPAQQQAAAGTGSSSEGHSWRPGQGTALWVLAMLAVAALLAAPAFLRPRLRRRRLGRTREPDQVAAAHAAWSEVVATAADLGIAYPDHHSLRVISALWARRAEMPDDAAAGLLSIAAIEERARYAARMAPASDDLADDVVRVVEGLAATVPPASRRRARLIPVSVLWLLTRPRRAEPVTAPRHRAAPQLSSAGSSRHGSDDSVYRRPRT